jgi:acyl carrier protein
MKEEIIKIIAKVTKIDPEILMAESNEYRQWDSMNHIEVLLLLEEEYDIRFSEEEMAELNSVNAICEIIGRMA